MNNILNELLPRTVRLWLYVIVGVAAAAFAAWQIADGDVIAFVGGLIATFSSWLAAGNISPKPDEPLPEPEVLSDQTSSEVAEQPPHPVYAENERGSGRNFYPDVFDQEGN